MMSPIKSIFFFALSVLSTASIAASIEWQCPGEHKDFKVYGVDPEYLARFTALFNESERLERTPEGIAYNPSMLKAANTFSLEVRSKCEADAKKANSPFFLAIEIVSSTGEIQEYLTMPPNPEYSCYARNVVGRHYPAPPTDHYPLGFVNILSTDSPTPSGKCIQKYMNLIIERDRLQNSAKAPASVGHP